MKRTKNQKKMKGVPSRNHNPRFLNLINAYTTVATHPTAIAALSLIPKSVFAGQPIHGTTKAIMANAREVRSSGLKDPITILRI